MRRRESAGNVPSENMKSHSSYRLCSNGPEMQMMDMIARARL